MGNNQVIIQPLRSFKCSLDGENWISFNTTSRGQAKMAFYRHLDGDYDYLYIKCRVNGPAQSSAEFEQVAKYRNVPFARCGMRVQVGNDPGIITGHNSSANFNVLFTGGVYSGEQLNCHPNSEIIYFADDGTVIKSFQKGAAAQAVLPHPSDLPF